MTLHLPANEPWIFMVSQFVFLLTTVYPFQENMIISFTRKTHATSQLHHPPAPKIWGRHTGLFSSLVSSSHFLIPTCSLIDICIYGSIVPAACSWSCYGSSTEEVQSQGLLRVLETRDIGLRRNASG